MKRTVASLVCLLHFAMIVLVETFMAVTIIWFEDYGHSLNSSIVVFVVIVLVLHCCGLYLLKKHKLIPDISFRILLYFDIVVCVTAFLAVIGCALCFAKMPVAQMVFITLINASILFTRIVINNRIKRV